MVISVSDPAAIGRVIRDTRRALGITQPNLALSVGVGVRFIVDVESGKPTAQIGKIMHVLAALGVDMQLNVTAKAAGTDGRP